MNDSRRQLANCTSATVTLVLFLGGKKYYGVVLVDYGLEGSDTVFIGNLLPKFRKSLLLNPANQPKTNEGRRVA
jgi:hypothetical protein